MFDVLVAVGSRAGGTHPSGEAEAGVPGQPQLRKSTLKAHSLELRSRGQGVSGVQGQPRLHSELQGA